MGSDVKVDSVFGEGSTFSVMLSLPISYVDKKRSDGHDLSGLRILLADKNEYASVYLAFWGADIFSLDGSADVFENTQAASSNGTPYDIVYLKADQQFATSRKIIERIQSQPETSATRFVLGTSNQNKDNNVEIDNTVYVEIGPHKRSAIIRAFAIAAGRASPDVIYDETNTPDAVLNPPSIEEAEAAGQLILLAEDNITNQRVILRQLHNLGYAADITNDGREALSALDRKSYTILLTDCHMPNLDGFGLTEAIRSSEVNSGNRLPIIAITASALKAEVDHCYEVGMDDFLSKPVEIPKLRNALRKWIPGDPPGKHLKKSVEPSEPVLDVDVVVDVSVLKEIFGDDIDTLKEILTDFIIPSRDCCQEIDTAFAENSSSGVAAASHKLKSSSRSIGANELADLCTDLEAAGKNDDWETINLLFPKLPNIMDKVSQYIETYDG